MLSSFPSQRRRQSVRYPGISKIKRKFYPENVRKLCRYFNLAETNPTLTDTIIHQKSPVVCMNDSNQEIPYLKVKEEIQRACEQILPDRSSFERY